MTYERDPSNGQTQRPTAERVSPAHHISQVNYATMRISFLQISLSLFPTIIQPALGWTNFPNHCIAYGYQRKTCSFALRGSIIIPDDFPLPRDEMLWKAEGERIIRSSVLKSGGDPDQVTVEWKSGKILVTVDGDVFLNADKKDSIEEEEEEVQFDGGMSDEAIIEFEEEFGGDTESEEVEGSNVVTIARAINVALSEEGEDSIGYSIAVHHEIEVTTPGASDELQGIMFESYKGFSVIAETIDPKNQKRKIVEGKLVERNDTYTIMNIKGRVRKIKNQTVQWVKLPKAKKEKGVR